MNCGISGIWRCRGAIEIVVMIVVAFGFTTGLSRAETPWPDFQSKLPANCQAMVQAPLPGDIRIVPPGPEVPPELARFSGIWTGWMCRDCACDTRLAVESVAGGGAKIVHTFNSKRLKSPNVERVDASFDNGELHATLSSGAQVFYRLRSDDVMDALWYKNSKAWAAGVLARKETGATASAGGAAPGFEKFVGSWCGKWMPGRRENRLEVQGVAADGMAQGIYDWGTARRSFSGRITGDTLRFEFPDYHNAKVAYRFGGDGSVSGTFNAEGDPTLKIDSKPCR
ncbi:MAG: hypothetical protein H6907_05040 [Hyphomicrobiales bacterium]|nr:hypothetical protein [Hyphomicrobiales bacterium]